MGRQSRRPLQQPFALSVGADDSVRPRDVPILRESSANSQLPNGPAESPAPTELRRIRTALQNLNAELIYRSYSNAAIYNPDVP